MKPESFTLSIELPMQRLTDLVTSALEGGSRYWYMIDTAKSNRVGTEFLVEEPAAGGSLCIMLLNEEDGPLKGKSEWTLDKEAMIRGIKLMATSNPRNFADFIQENDDAETGDVFLQLCLFGEVVFG